MAFKAVLKNKVGATVDCSEVRDGVPHILYEVEKMLRENDGRDCTIEVQVGEIEQPVQREVVRQNSFDVV